MFICWLVFGQSFASQLVGAVFLRLVIGGAALPSAAMLRQSLSDVKKNVGNIPFLSRNYYNVPWRYQEGRLR